MRFESPADKRARTVVLLVQLGTPTAPSASALRAFLREFLSDRRVVEMPRALWLPLLYGIILPLRPARSAAKYAAIWTKEGSPLLLHTRRQTSLLQGWLGQHGHDVDVRHAMRYGTPSIASVLDECYRQGLERLLVMPLYPQYAASSTATVFDAVTRVLARWRVQPAVRLVRDFHDQDTYLEALAQRVRDLWAREGRCDRLLISFHGIPQRSVTRGDPYGQQCRRTAEQLAARLGLSEAQWMLTFQSRFGPAPWLQPYTSASVVECARRGERSIDVVCPGFVADCLETLEEISIEVRSAFLAAGGERFRYIPALNDAPGFIQALGELAEANLAGWQTQRCAGVAGPGEPVR